MITHLSSSVSRSKTIKLWHIDNDRYSIILACSDILVFFNVPKDQQYACIRTTGPYRF